MPRKDDRHVKKLALALLLIGIAAAALAGCQVQTDRTEKPAPDWSRALAIGRANLRQPVALAVDSDRHVHLVWCNDGLFYAHLDEQAHVLFNGPLAIDVPRPRHPQLLIDRQNAVHLVWLSRDGNVQKLYHTMLNAEGQPGLPELLSDPAHDVNRFQLFLSPTDGVSAIWDARLDGAPIGLVYAALNAPTEPTTLSSRGIDPYVLVDRTATVHVAWFEVRGFTSRSVHYATLDESSASSPRLSPADGHKLADFDFSESGVYVGPVIGLDATHIYVLWSVQNLGGGLTPTSAFSYYVAFKPGETGVQSPQRINLPASNEPVYEPHVGDYGLTRLAPLSAADLGYSSDFVNSPATVTTQRDELVVACSLLTRSTAHSWIQLATVVLADGDQVGYQLASKTENASLTPTLVADADAYLHLAWIDTSGFSEFDVYYATNAPAARAWLDRTSTDDLVLGAAELLWGVLSGIGLLPIAGIWTFPAMVWVVAFFVASGQEEMKRAPTKIGFAIAIVIYVGVKILLLPGLFRGTPLLQLVPSAWAVPVGIAVPSLILVIALSAVYMYIRKAERATIFMAYFVLALVDVGLTIVLYAPRFFDPG